MPYYLRSQKSLKSTLGEELLSNDSTSDSDSAYTLKETNLKVIEEEEEEETEEEETEEKENIQLTINNQ